MSTVTTLADFMEQLGNIPPERILFDPLPGMATEDDVLEVERRTGLAPELIDGVLVEKAVGLAESVLAHSLSFQLQEFVKPRKLGWVAGAVCILRLFPGRIRLPDVCFISREQVPSGELPDEPVADIVPELVVEILSRSNTRGEMQRKLHDYFAAGVRLVWYIEPREQTVSVYKSPEDRTMLGENDTLDGGDVLPGFRMELRELFAALKLE